MGNVNRAVRNRIQKVSEAKSKRRLSQFCVL